MRRLFYKLALVFVEHLYYKNKWARKFTGGTWYCMRTALPMTDIWNREKFTSCQARCINTEVYNGGIKYIDQV